MTTRDQASAALIVRVDEALWCVAPDADEPRWSVSTPGMFDHVAAGAHAWALSTARRLHGVRASDGAVLGDVAVPGVGPLAASPFAPGLVAAGGPDAWQARWLDGGVADVRALPPCDVAVPVAPDRVIVARDGHVALVRGHETVWTAQLTGGVRATAGALCLDGRIVVVVGRRLDSDALRIHVISTRDGTLHHTLTAAGAKGIVIAPARGWAVVRIGEHRLSIVDLRLGRVVRVRDEQETVHDVAVDAAFSNVALRLGDPPGLVITTGNALVASSEQADRDTVALAAPAPPPRSSTPAEPAAVVVPPLVVPPLRALARIDPPPAASVEEVAVDLQARLRWIGALLDLAIAEAWDSGRIASPADSALPFELEVTATLLHATGRAQPQLDRAKRHLAHYEKVRADVDARRAGRATPLSRLADEVGLSPLAVDLLIAIAAPLLWGELARPYGILTNDPARPLVDELLLHQLLAPRATRAEIARELDRDRPLRHAGLVHVDDRRTRPFAGLRLDPLVVGVLRDVDPHAELGDVVVRPATVALDRVRVPRESLEPVLTALAVAGDRPVRLVARGRLGSGRRTLLAAIAAAAGRALGLVDGSATGDDHEARAARIARALHRCRMLGWLPCVDGLDDVTTADHPAAASLRAVFREHPGPLGLRWQDNVPAPLDPGHHEIELPRMSETARAEVWSEALAGHGLPATDANELAARYRVGPGVIARAAERAASSLAAAETPPTAVAATAAAEAAVRQHLDDRLGVLATRVTRLAGWADLIVPEDILDCMLELVSRVRHRRLVFEQWGYDRRVTSGRGITALFQGSPGTGKTLAAGVLARELGLDLYRVDVSQLVSKWVGETEKNLAAVFDAAEDGQVVLLFDEADSLFAKRTEVKSSVDRYANLEVNYLLQRLDTFDGIAILTSNFGGSIDPAFRRRLSMMVTFPFPDEEMREKIWQAHLPAEVPRGDDLDLAALAQRFRLSGGYIRNAALRAAFLAAEEGAAVGQQYLERAIRLEYRSVGKLTEGGALE